MAKFKRGILGGFQGKLGTVVGTRWRGINVMRALPEKVTNPNTIKQRQQRERFKLVSELMKKARPVIEVGFEQTGSPNRTASNAAMSWNIKFGIKGSYPGQEFDFPQIRFAMGSLEGINGMQVTGTHEELTFSWSDNSGTMNATSEDQLIIVLYNEAKKELIYALDLANRNAGTAILAIPESQQASELHVWFAMHNSERNISSNSVYLGKVNE